MDDKSFPSWMDIQNRIQHIEDTQMDLQNRMQRMEDTQMKQIVMLQKILKLLQQQQQGTTEKPPILPVSSLVGMAQFEEATDDTYQETVNYLQYVGGLTLKEAVSLCFKEAFDDCILTKYSWLGREESNLPLCETRMVRAIHDAVIQNRNYAKPSRKEIADAMRTALRTAKERIRSRSRGRRNFEGQNLHSFWTAEEEDA